MQSQFFREVGALNNLYAGGLHLSDGVVHIGGAEVDAAGGVFDEVGFKTESDGVEGGEIDAVIGGKAADIDVGDAARFEPFAEAGGFAMAVVEEAAVAIDGWVGSFLEDFFDAGLFERGGEFGAFCILDAVHWPEDLRQTIQIDLVVNVFAGMIGGEAAVVGRVPILRRDDDIEGGLQFVRNRNEFVALRDGESAARKEIILNIDQYECRHELVN
jgi:hypothetical protein